MMHVFVSRPVHDPGRKAYSNLDMRLGEEDPIQSNPTKLDRPPARSLHDSESEVGVGQQRASAVPPWIPFKLGRRRRRRPQIASLPFPCQDPPNSAPPLFLSPPSPRLLATESAGRQIHPLPPWSKAGRQAPAAVQRARQPARNSFSTSSFSGHPQPEPGGHRQGRAGQGRADNRHQLLLQIIGRI